MSYSESSTTSSETTTSSSSGTPSEIEPVIPPPIPTQPPTDEPVTGSNEEQPETHQEEQPSNEAPPPQQAPPQPAEKPKPRQKRKDDFNLGKVLGQGAFGQVLEVEDKETKKHYAMKVLSKMHIMREKKMNYGLVKEFIDGIENGHEMLNKWLQGGMTHEQFQDYLISIYLLLNLMHKLQYCLIAIHYPYQNSD